MIMKILSLALSLILLTGCAGGEPAGTVAGTAGSGNDNESSDKDATLTFSSFDGGGPDFSLDIADPEIADYSRKRVYDNPNHEELDGAGYKMIFTFTGKKEGETTAKVTAFSPIADNFEMTYKVAVDSDLKVTLTLIEEKDSNVVEPLEYMVDYDGRKDFYENARDYYAPGEIVELYYGIIATDTDYSFYLDGEPLNYGYDEDIGFIITFEMPDHDVKLTVESRNTMVMMSFNATVNAMWAEDFNYNIPGSRTVDIQAGEGAASVVFFTDEPVSNFKIHSLHLKFLNDDAAPEYLTIERVNAGELTPDEPLTVDLNFTGDIPENAVSYEDVDGTERYFILDISGYDGSLTLTEF